MIINILKQEATYPFFYTIVEEKTGAMLTGKLDEASFVEVTPPGKPPYTVYMTCNSVKGLSSGDFMVSWLDSTSKGIYVTRPLTAAQTELTEAEAVEAAAQIKG